MKEKDLIERCIKEDPTAQKELYETYVSYILSICRRFGLQETDLKDAIQEIFIEVFLSLKQYNTNKGELKYWVKTIAIRKLIKLRRKKHPLTVVNLEDVALEKSTPLDYNIQALDTEYITALIAGLPDGYRTVFNLFVIDGYSHKEIAHLLEIDVASSRSQLSRAKSILRTKLKEYFRKNSYGFI